MQITRKGTPKDLVTAADIAVENYLVAQIKKHYPDHGSTWTPGAAVRAGDWKLIEFYEDNTVELYNLKDDLGEKNDLSKSHPKKTKELLEMLHQWQKETNAKMPTPNPNYKK